MRRRFSPSLHAGLASLVIAISPRLAHASGQGVGLVLGGLLGAVPSLVLGIVHAGLAMRLDAGHRGGVLPRIAAATAAAVVGSFVLQGVAEAYATEGAWLALALVINESMYALAAAPLTLALRRGGETRRAWVVLVASLVGPLLLAAAMLAGFSR